MPQENRIQIRRGSGVPTTSALNSYELGFSTTVGNLYINDGTSIVRVGGSFEVTGTLTAGSTSLTLSDARITSNSTIFPYTTVWGVQPLSVAVSSGSVTLTFASRANDLGVKVEVHN